MPEGIAPDAWELAGKAMGWPDINRDLLRRRVANAIMADRQSRPSRPDHEALIERLRAYALDWRERAASKDIIDEAIAALSSPQPPAPAPLGQTETDNG